LRRMAVGEGAPNPAVAAVANPATKVRKTRESTLKSNEEI